jgi:hypothetical protein
MNSSTSFAFRFTTMSPVLRGPLCPTFLTFAEGRTGAARVLRCFTADRDSKVERNRSRSSPAERSVAHRRTSHQPHRRTAAAECRGGTWPTFIPRCLNILDHLVQTTFGLTLTANLHLARNKLLVRAFGVSHWRGGTTPRAKDSGQDVSRRFGQQRAQNIALSQRSA